MSNCQLGRAVGACSRVSRLNIGITGKRDLVGRNCFV